MENDLEKLLKSAFADPASLSHEKLEEVVQETIRSFTALGSQLHSSDPEQKEGAKQAIQTIKDLIQGQSSQIAQKLGIDPSELSSFAENTDNFSDDEWAELTEMKEELSAFQEALSPQKTTE